MTTATKNRLLGCALAGLTIAAVAKHCGSNMTDAATLGSMFGFCCTLISMPDAKLDLDTSTTTEQIGPWTVRSAGRRWTATMDHPAYGRVVHSTNGGRNRLITLITRRDGTIG